MPLLEQPAILWTAMAYFALVVWIGAWAARRTRSARDFFIAGQSVGLLVTALATMSAAFSGFVFLGGPGLTYRMGAASLFICVSVSFTGGMLCWVVGKRLRLLAEVREVFTVPDAVLCRFGSRAASGSAAVAIILGTVGYLGAQLQAMAVTIEAILGTREALGFWSLPAAMALGLVVVLSYSVAGGMVAGVYTDVLQGALMVGAAAAVFWKALESVGGVEAAARRIAASDAFGASFLDPLGHVPPLTALGFFFVFSVGTLGQPHMLHKFFMLDDPRKMRWLPLTLGVSQTVCILLWMGIGLAVPALVASGAMAPLTNPDDAAPAFVLGFAPQILAGLVFAAVLAAIMSTADSLVNLGAAALVRDLPRALGLPVRHELAWGRLAVLGLALAAAAFALLYGDLIALLGTFAFGTFAAALAPAMAVGLNWRRVTAPAATASIAGGLVLHLVLEVVTRAAGRPLPFAPGVLPAAASLATSFAILFLVTWLTGRREGPAVPRDVAAVLEL